MVSKEQIYSYLENVCDPEVPVLSVLDLGIIRDVEIDKESISVKITPTYSGCPAMNTIAANVKFELLAQGFKNIMVEEVLSPPWTTDWMSDEGKRKLKEFGIAPPQYQSKENPLEEDAVVPCPQCDSNNTEIVSQFGSTSCKALYKCKDCLEPFDYFKCY
jgi:ring-1,2-phenylacetyl-CoA epoxidase subunit PaaD